MDQEVVTSRYRNLAKRSGGRKPQVIPTAREEEEEKDESGARSGHRTPLADSAKSPTEEITKADDQKRDRVANVIKYLPAIASILTAIAGLVRACS